jgi:hypothetical protein
VFSLSPCSAVGDLGDLGDLEEVLETAEPSSSMLDTSSIEAAVATAQRELSVEDQVPAENDDEIASALGVTTASFDQTSLPPLTSSSEDM